MILNGIFETTKEGATLTLDNGKVIYSKKHKDFHDEGCEGTCTYCLMVKEIWKTYGKEKL